ncbi:hypothetical protein BSN85_04670 [Bradyrhizobium brasilense]|nr:hypothetical protein BSN85_04670 [Bradyrhizobium brasilense]
MAASRFRRESSRSRDCQPVTSHERATELSEERPVVIAPFDARGDHAAGLFVLTREEFGARLSK